MSNRRARGRRTKKRDQVTDVQAPDETQFEEPYADEEGPGRRWPRRLWAAMRVLCGVALVLGMSAVVAFGAHRYALTTPRFAIQSVDVEGARRLTSEQVQELAGVQVGANVFALDVASAEARLVESPWVAQARIVRRLPGHVRIELQEREAGALVVISDEIFVATRSGEVFKRFEEGDPFDLPTVTGLRADALARDRDRELERLESALDLLRQYDRVPLAHVFPAQEVHLGEEGSFVLTVGQQGLTLHLGSGPWKQKLLRATRVVERAQARGQLPNILFLDNQAHPERVVVRIR